MKTYYLYQFFAYNQQSQQGDFMESVEIKVIDHNLKSAEKRVRGLVKRKFYYLKSIIEYVEESKN